MLGKNRLATFDQAAQGTFIQNLKTNKQSKTFGKQEFKSIEKFKKPAL